MKKRLILSVGAALLFAGASPAQEDPPFAAVYATGNIRLEDAKAVATFMMTSLINSGGYRGVERPDAFVTELNEALLAAASAEGGENPVSVVGKRFGARYVCVATVTPVTDAVQINAYMMDVETGGAVFTGGAVGAIATLADLTTLSDNAVRDMLSKPTAQAAAEPEEAPPEPEVYEAPAAQSDLPKPADPNENVSEGEELAIVPRKPPKKQSAPAAENASSIGITGVFAGDFGGGTKLASGTEIPMPYYGWGAYLFFDVVYVEMSAGYQQGNGKMGNSNAAAPNLYRQYINLGLYGKVPIKIGTIKYFPLAGFDWNLALGGGVNTSGGSGFNFDGRNDPRNFKHPEAGALSVLWFNFGAGADIPLSNKTFARGALLYGWRLPSKWEEDLINNRLGSAEALQLKYERSLPGHGLTIKAGAGIKF